MKLAPCRQQGIDDCCSQWVSRLGHREALPVLLATSRVGHGPQYVKPALVCTFPSWLDFWREIRTPSLASHPSLPPHTQGRCSSEPLNPPDPRGDLISCLRVQFGRVGWFISQPLALRLAQKLVSLSALLTAHVVACCDTLIVELLAAMSGLCTLSKQHHPGFLTLLKKALLSFLSTALCLLCMLSCTFALHCIPPSAQII